MRGGYWCHIHKCTNYVLRWRGGHAFSNPDLVVSDIFKVTWEWIKFIFVSFYLTIPSLERKGKERREGRQESQEVKEGREKEILPLWGPRWLTPPLSLLSHCHAPASCLLPLMLSLAVGLQSSSPSQDPQPSCVAPTCS